jgi:polysaccharide export outer membrane protein
MDTAWLQRMIAFAATCIAAGVFAQEAAGPDLKMSRGLSIGTTPLASLSPSVNAAGQPPSAKGLGQPGTALAPRSLLQDYRIGPDDLLEVQVFGVDLLTRTVRVNSRGQVSLPLIGAVDVQGLTAQEAETVIARRLAGDYLQNPQVSLFIREFTSQRITVEGAVQKPGVYPLRGTTTLLQALAIAGGQGNLSDMHDVMLFRADGTGKRASQVFDVEKIRHGEIEDPTIVNDDLIVVNRSPGRVFLRDSAFRDLVETINPFHW